MPYIHRGLILQKNLLSLNIRRRNFFRRRKIFSFQPVTDYDNRCKTHASPLQLIAPERHWRLSICARLENLGVLEIQRNRGGARTITPRKT
jgi:hypothetical protein